MTGREGRAGRKEASGGCASEQPTVVGNWHSILLGGSERRVAQSIPKSFLPLRPTHSHLSLVECCSRWCQSLQPPQLPRAQAEHAPGAGGLLLGREEWALGVEIHQCGRELSPEVASDSHVGLRGYGLQEHLLHGRQGGGNLQWYQ